MAQSLSSSPSEPSTAVHLFSEAELFLSPVEDEEPWTGPHTGMPEPFRTDPVRADPWSSIENDSVALQFDECFITAAAQKQCTNLPLEAEQKLGLESSRAATVTFCAGHATEEEANPVVTRSAPDPVQTGSAHLQNKQQEYSDLGSASLKKLLQSLDHALESSQPSVPVARWIMDEAAAQELNNIQAELKEALFNEKRDDIIHATEVQNASDVSVADGDVVSFLEGLLEDEHQAVHVEGLGEIEDELAEVLFGVADSTNEKRETDVKLETLPSSLVAIETFLQKLRQNAEQPNSSGIQPEADPAASFSLEQQLRQSAVRMRNIYKDLQSTMGMPQEEQEERIKESKKHLGSLQAELEVLLSVQEGKGYTEGRPVEAQERTVSCGEDGKLQGGGEFDSRLGSWGQAPFSTWEMGAPQTAEPGYADPLGSSNYTPDEEMSAELSSTCVPLCPTGSHETQTSMTQPHSPLGSFGMESNTILPLTLTGSHESVCPPQGQRQVSAPGDTRGSGSHATAGTAPGPHVSNLPVVSFTPGTIEASPISGGLPGSDAVESGAFDRGMSRWPKRQLSFAEREALLLKAQAMVQGGAVPAWARIASRRRQCVLPEQVRGTLSSSWVALGEKLWSQGATLGLERFLENIKVRGRPASRGGSGLALPRGVPPGKWAALGSDHTRVMAVVGAGEHCSQVPSSSARGVFGSSLSGRLAVALDVIKGPSRKVHRGSSPNSNAGEVASPTSSPQDTLGTGQKHLTWRHGSFGRRHGAVGPAAPAMPCPAMASAAQFSSVPHLLLAQGQAQQGIQERALMLPVARPVMGEEAKVRGLLLLAAQAVDQRDVAAFHMLAAQLKPHNKPRGAALERLVATLLEALQLRLEGTAFARLKKPSRTPIQQTEEARMWYYTSAPYCPFAAIFTVGMILPALVGHSHVHIVNIGEAVIPQWPPFIKMLRRHSETTGHLLERFTFTYLNAGPLARPGRPEYDIMKSQGRIAAVMKEAASSVGVEFTFQAVTVSEENFGLIDTIQRLPDEALAACSVFDLHFFSDDFSVAGGARMKLLQCLRRLCPDIMTSMEEEWDGSSPNFMTRFAGSVDFLLPMFSSHDAVVRSDDPKRIRQFEQKLFSFMAVSVVSCEGPQRRFSPTLSFQRSNLFRVHGFSPEPIPDSIIEVQHDMLRSFPDGFGLFTQGEQMFLMWQGSKLFSASAWLPSPDRILTQ